MEKIKARLERDGVVESNGAIHEGDEDLNYDQTLPQCAGRWPSWFVINMDTSHVDAYKIQICLTVECIQPERSRIGDIMVAESRQGEYVTKHYTRFTVSVTEQELGKVHEIKSAMDVAW